MTMYFKHTFGKLENAYYKQSQLNAAQTFHPIVMDVKVTGGSSAHCIHNCIA